AGRPRGGAEGAMPKQLPSDWDRPSQLPRRKQLLSPRAGDSFPWMALGENNQGLPIYYHGMYSIHVRLLPYLDQAVLFDAINFMVPAYPEPPDPFTGMPLSELSGLMVGWNAMNQTTRFTGIGLFLCPSDAGAFTETGNNYRGNT